MKVERINWRHGIMLLAAGILVLLMLTVFVRFGARHILVKWARVDNCITQTILYDNTGLQKIDTNVITTNMEWDKVYPFANIDVEKNNITSPANSIESKVTGIKKKIVDWTGERLLEYHRLAELGREYEMLIGWNLINPDSRVVSLDDGAWSFAYPRHDVHEGVKTIIDLAEAVQGSGANFLYIQAPFKIDKYGDYGVNGIVDFTNQNCDDALVQLQTNGVATLDLREDLHRWSQIEQCSYHDYFFCTDHHWRPETALRVASVVGNRLKDYGVPVDDRHFKLQDFDIEVLPQYFLGSQGKRATLAKAKPDDFSVLHPTFDTYIKLNIPEKKIADIGSFELVYDKQQIEKRDYYHSNPYSMYGYGDMAIMDIENLLLPPTNKKVLLIKDSFGDTMAPFLALGIRNLMTLDIRYFTGSVRNYIAEQKPDVVIVMYTGAPTDHVDWASHKDKYDFR